MTKSKGTLIIILSVAFERPSAFMRFLGHGFLGLHFKVTPTSHSHDLLTPSSRHNRELRIQCDVAGRKLLRHSSAESYQPRQNLMCQRHWYG